MNWRKEYAAKLLSLSEAAGKVKSGDNVVTSIGVGLPYMFFDALAERSEELENVQVFYGALAKRLSVLDPKYGKAFRGIDYFMAAPARAALSIGSTLQYQAIHLSNISNDRFKKHIPNVVAMVGTPPDENGMISLGPCPIDSKFLDVCETVIVQVNEKLPYVRGWECMFPVDRVTWLTEGTEELEYAKIPEPSKEEEAIAALIAERVPDGACIQLGTGGMGNAMGHNLSCRKDLGIHTEMFVETMVELMKCGAVNNSKKNICRGFTTYGFANGSRKMYEFMDHNEHIEARPVRWVNDPRIIAQNDNMVSVNGALQIDLTGQVCAESIGQKQYTGTGGQVDFVRGARWSKGGMSFIAMPSSRIDSKTGKRVSKISLTLPLGSAVTTLRSDIQYFVTEYGIADLEDEPLDVRAKRLIEVAHPDFRDELRFEAKKSGLII